MAESTAERPASSFSEAVGALASSLRESAGPGRRGLSRGDRAELRRMAVKERVPPEAYWNLAREHPMLERDYRFWREVIPFMVRHPHSRGAHPGRVLEQAKVSPSRVERWLRLDRNDALHQTGRLLSKVEGGIDWVQLAGLLMTWDDAGRLRFAKDFYLSGRPDPKNNSADREGQAE